MIRVLTTICLAAFIFSSCEKKQQPSMRERIASLNELQLVECTMAKTYTVRDAYDTDVENEQFNFINWLEHTFKMGDRIGVYGLRRSYSAYINLNEITEDDIVIKENTIHLTLPKVKIRTLGNDIIPIVYHERVSGLRSTISETERLTMRNKASELLDKEIVRKGNTLLPDMEQQAKEKAKSWFVTLLREWGYEAVITFKKQ